VPFRNVLRTGRIPRRSRWIWLDIGFHPIVLGKVFPQVASVSRLRRDTVGAISIAIDTLDKHQIARVHGVYGLKSVDGAGVKFIEKQENSAEFEREAVLKKRRVVRRAHIHPRPAGSRPEAGFIAYLLPTTLELSGCLEQLVPGRGLIVQGVLAQRNPKL
jgi:hypothetical protein